VSVSFMKHQAAGLLTPKWMFHVNAVFPVLGEGVSIASPSVSFATRAGWEVIENTISVDRQ